MLTIFKKAGDIIVREGAEDNDAYIICERNTYCQKRKCCDRNKKKKEVSWTNQVRKDIIKSIK